MSKVKKSFGRKCIKLLVKPIAYMIYRSPIFIKKAIAFFIAVLWWDILRLRRSVVLDNLGKAFPNMSEPEKVKMGRQSIYHLGLNFVEFFYFPFIDTRWVEKNVEFKGLENVDRALEGGRGAILLGLHLGNGDLAMVGLCHADHPVFLISKLFKSKWLNDLWFDLRGRHGIQFIDPEKSTFEILRALRKNERVVFVLDQFMGPPVGVKTSFFGHETGTALGLALIAERVGSPVIPSYSYRRQGNKMVVELLPPVPLVKGETRDETLQKTTQAYNDKIQEIVQSYPEQWMWLHKRWKPFRE